MSASTTINGSVRLWNRYPAYAPPGSQWLAELPSHWRTKRLKYVANIQTGLTLGKDYAGRHMVARPYLRVANVQDGYLDLETISHVSVPAEDVQRHELCPGDVLMTEGGDFDKLGRGYVWDGQIEGCLHQNHIFAVRPKQTILEPHFLASLMTSAHGKNYFTATSQQTTNLASTNSTKLRNFPLPVPSVTEQRTILKFLDRETSNIDALIAKKERLIELLQEQRIALISHAVTKGIDLNVPMKDSGVEWLGKIPAHWGVIQSRRVFKVRNEPASESDEQLTASQKYGMLLQTEFMELEGRRVVVTIKGVDSLRHVEPNDFVISLRSFQGGIEWCKLRGSVTFHYVVLKPVKEIHPAYFGHLFKSSVFIQALRSTTDFIRDGQDLRYSHFILVPLPMALMREQAAIASFLDRETDRLDRLIAKVREAIDKLREYRTALISAAVTGKIDVREEVA